MEYTWNTKAKYTAEGQIIRAAQTSDGSILMADVSRMVDGRIAAPKFHFRDVGDFVDYVNNKYLRSEMTHDAASLKFLHDTYGQRNRGEGYWSVESQNHRLGMSRV